MNARELLRKYGLQAKKSWGQNFLVDERAYQAIVEACALGEGDWVVEIGAGLGTLTARLGERAAHVIAVERDRDMVAVLRGELGENARIEIAEANALTYDYAAVAERAGKRPTIVGNLPYQIASPILFRILEMRQKVARLVVMLQREMVDRILAAPSTPEYGALGVMVRMYGETKLVRKVPAGRVRAGAARRLRRALDRSGLPKRARRCATSTCSAAWSTPPFSSDGRRCATRCPSSPTHGRSTPPGSTPGGVGDRSPSRNSRA